MKIASQIGGSHYESKSYQPIEFIVKNNLFFAEGNVVKYLTRWRSKNGLEDLQKAKWYVSFLAENSSFVGRADISVDDFAKANNLCLEAKAIELVLNRKSYIDLEQAQAIIDELVRIHKLGNQNAN